MTTYTIPLLATPSQSFTCQLGGNSVRIRIQWMTRFEKFRVDIEYANGNPITLGRILVPNVNLFNGVYPPGGNFGTLMLTGETPTPDTLGVDSELVWIDG